MDAGEGGRRGLVAGFDVGGTKILGRVLDADDPRRAVVTRRVDTPRGSDAILAALVEMTSAFAEDLERAGQPPLVALGAGVAGLVDRAGVLHLGPNLPGAEGLDVPGGLARATGLVVVADNDANAAAWAEHRIGAGVGARDLVLVALGTGIGGALIVADQLCRGAEGFAGEPGHMIVDPNGPPCPCGRRGCWERFASGSGLGRLAREAAVAGRAERIVALAGGDPEDVRGEDVTRAAADGDPAALEVMADFAWWVALGLANLENLLDPEVIVIGGGLADAGELLMAPTRAAYAELVLGAGHRRPARIAAAALGADAGAIGAGLLAADAVGDRAR